MYKRQNAHREMIQRLEVAGTEADPNAEEGTSVGRPMAELLRDAPVHAVRSNVCCDDLAARRRCYS